MMENTNNYIEEEPFYYCKKCLSINIREEAEGLTFCSDCGSLNLVECYDMDAWLDLYNQQYDDDETKKQYRYSENRTNNNS